jgi:hypothetical protein
MVIQSEVHQNTESKTQTSVFSYIEYYQEIIKAFETCKIQCMTSEFEPAHSVLNTELNPKKNQILLLK